MFRIRAEQVDAFRVAAVRSYEDRVAAHVERCFPQEFGDLGDLKVRRIIREGISRASNYGIVSERDVCLFIDLMVELGPNFDTDAEFPWASAILQDREEDGSEKIDRVFSMALAWTDEDYSQELADHEEAL
jgi:hypothetical protein